MKLAESDVSRHATVDEPCGQAAASAAEHLRRQILDGDLRPGAVLVKSRLCRQVRVRPPALHEALSLLEQEGLLVQAAGPGCRFEVARLSPLDVADVYEVREVLDSLGARLAAAVGLSAEMEERFAAATEAMEKARARSLDADAFERAHATWHLTLFEASGNPGLMRSSRLVRVVSHCLVMRSLPPAVRRLFSTTISEMVDTGVEEHVRILRAIRTGNAADAEHLAWRHVRRCTNFSRVVGTQFAATLELAAEA